MTPHPMSPAAAGLAAGLTLVHWPAATNVFSANAPMPSAGDSARPSRVIFCVRVERGEAIPRTAPQTGPAVAAHGAPVEHDEITGHDVGDVGSDGLDDARRLVPEQEREVVVDGALAVVEVGVADPARLHAHERFARTRDRAPRWSRSRPACPFLSRRRREPRVPRTNPPRSGSADNSSRRSGQPGPSGRAVRRRGSATRRRAIRRRR